MQHGQVTLSWMDVLQLILEEPSWAAAGGGGLRDRVFEIAPEFASKLSDWKNMLTLATRVHKRVYDFLETAMALRECSHGCGRRGCSHTLCPFGLCV